MLITFKEHIEPHTIIVGDFNTPFSQIDIMETETKQRHRETIRKPMGLTDIYRTSHPKTKEYTFFSVPHGTFSKN
jgi:exonuclease III